MRHRNLLLLASSVLLASCSAATSSVPSPSVPVSSVPDGASDAGPRVYKPGDTGPGGGIVFLAAPEPFLCGEDLKSSCLYLEASPVADEVHRTWVEVAAFPVLEQVSGANSGAIGAGLANSLDIANHPGSSSANSAAVYALNYTHGGLSDWYLPSLSEMNELCKFAHGQPTGEYSVPCGTNIYHGEPYVPPTFISRDQYWTSSEDVPPFEDSPSYGNAWSLDGNLGHRQSRTKNFEYRVRPIRAF